MSLRPGILYLYSDDDAQDMVTEECLLRNLQEPRNCLLTRCVITLRDAAGTAQGTYLIETGRN